MSTPRSLNFQGAYVLFEQVALTPSGFAARSFATTTGGSRRTSWEAASIETRKCRQSALLLTGERKEIEKEHYSAATTSAIPTNFLSGTPTR
jgi:hypothetical protein